VAVREEATKPDGEELRPENEALLALLDKWAKEEPLGDDAWWDAFGRELREIRNGWGGSEKEELLEALAGIFRLIFPMSPLRDGDPFTLEFANDPIREAVRLLVKHGKLRKVDGRYEWAEK